MLAGRSLSDELMDDPALDLATYAAVLGDLAKVNTVTMARRPTLAFLERALVGAKSFRLLDVGFGDGDMLRAIARWASGRGIMAELVGIDLNPLSATNPDDVRWLRSLVWPGEDAREQRLADCLEVVRQDPPRIVTGDAIDLLPQVLAQVPAGLTPVVYHSAVLAYFHRDDRRRFVDLVADLGVHWVSLEGAKVVPGIADRLPSEVPEPAMAVSLDGRPLCWTQHHGAWVDWFGR